MGHVHYLNTGPEAFPLFRLVLGFLPAMMPPLAASAGHGSCLSRFASRASSDYSREVNVHDITDSEQLRFEYMID